MKTPIRTLVAPLDWGLGHATRCIPLIRKLLDNNDEVFLAGSGASLQLLRNEFPHLNAFELPAYNVRYGKKGSILAILMQIPRLIYVIFAEHRILKKLVQTYGIDVVISDNRYGCWVKRIRNKRIRNIFVCHQIAILPPQPFLFLRPVLFRFHMLLMHPFQEVWIPDAQKEAEQRTLSGTLSHYKPLPPKFKFIGWLSRFAHPSVPTAFSLPALNVSNIDILVVLSGPEPQRSLFEQIILEQATSCSRHIWLLQGKPTSEKPTISHRLPHITLISHLETPDLQRALTLAHVVVSRSGYSSLMDYATLGLKNLVFVPTQGQTEQEYLAGEWARQNYARYFPQTDFHLHKC